MKKKTRYYLLITVEDVEIEKRGPFVDPSNRDAAARDHKRKRGDEDGIHWMDVTTRLEHNIGLVDPDVDVQIEVGDYSNAFFEGCRP
jgi:hypothetical protein